MVIHICTFMIIQGRNDRGFVQYAYTYFGKVLHERYLEKFAEIRVRVLYTCTPSGRIRYLKFPARAGPPGTGRPDSVPNHKIKENLHLPELPGLCEVQVAKSRRTDELPGCLTVHR